MINVAITGGSGFLGGRLVRAMLGLGWHVTVITRAASDVTALLDVRNSIDLIMPSGADGTLESIGPVDIVVHTATCYGRRGESTSEMQSANVGFPLQILNLAVAGGARLFCNTDTILSRYTDAYSLSKKQFLEWLQLQSASGKIRAVNLVLDQFYGPGQSCARFVPWLVRQCLIGTEIPLTHGTQKRRFLYIDDLVYGYLKAIQACFSGMEPYHEIQIASSTLISVREVAEKVHALSNSRAKLSFGSIPLRTHEPSESNIDLSGLQMLGWKERVSLDEGLMNVIAYERGFLH